MKSISRIIAICAALTPLAIIPIAAAQTKTARLVLAADSDWKFLLGDPSGAEARSFADNSWRTVNLPHDWSIESPPDKNNPTASGGGFFPAGTGWYRKTFTAPPDWQGKRVSVELDGVYRNATIYFNGTKLGTQPYGYTSFRFDLTPQLDFPAPNVLAVRVDNSAQPNSRWYSGSGIYRHVRVVVTDPTHVAHWGVFVTTPEVTASAASVLLRTRVANESATDATVTVKTTLTDRSGKQVGHTQSALTLAPNSDAEATHQISVAKPALWSPESPALYRATTQILKDNKVLDEVVTPFGIRSISWSSERGFLLNGKSIKLAGGSVHHDNGPLGAAAFDRAEQRRVQLLKTAGFNAVRTAHNPPSPAFLDACDRLGLLVLDEPFDAWTASKLKFDYSRDFNDWWQRDLTAMVLRDRNHPSIVVWSIGNEIPEVFVERGGPLAKRIADQVRSLDATRPVTQAMPGSTSGPNQKSVFSVLDIGGYNYNLAKNFADDHRDAPSRVMMTTESFPADAFAEWQLSQDHPFIIGEFVWTAMDYLGESGIGAAGYGTPQQAAQIGMVSAAMSGMIDQYFIAMANGVDPMAAMAQNAQKDASAGDQTSQNNADSGPMSVMAFLMPSFPWHMSQSGDIDLLGFRKPQSFYRDVLWNGGDRVYATVRLPEPEGKKTVVVGWSVYPTLPSWTWPGQDGKDLQVEIYSGAEKVQLFLNGKLIGEEPTGREQQFKALFTVPYAPGTLKAVGLRGHRAVAESVLTTVGKPVHLRLTADRTALQADGQDLSFITVEALDAHGKLQPNADQEIHFVLTGPGVIAAVGNANGRDNAPYQGDHRKLFQGRALIVVRTNKQSGSIHLTASTAGLTDSSIDLQAKPAPRRAELH